MAGRVSNLHRSNQLVVAILDGFTLVDVGGEIFPHSVQRLKRAPRICSLSAAFKNPDGEVDLAYRHAVSEALT
jgi:hypothetical protein